eukprot:TRINITY_DN9642_c0_g1_i1.p2 TRINITY_DN9642_c0_g1~~TRINITY_DN9642_c0_g1_i1.p2  ORF type:complete len:71 (-),score=12.63 TRINITY_DN9642_c0_g1_i1:39-251(-)
MVSAWMMVCVTTGPQMIFWAELFALCIVATKCVDGATLWLDNLAVANAAPEPPHCVSGDADLQEYIWELS